MNPALVAAMNNPNKGMGTRPLGLLPSLDGFPVMKDYNGPLWVSFSMIGGAKSPRTMSALIGDFPQQTSMSEWVQMTAGGVDGGGGLIAPPTPMVAGGGGGMSMGDMG